MTLSFVSTDLATVKALAQELWNRFPLYVSPIVAIAFGLILVCSPESYRLGRGFALFKEFTQSGAWPGLALVLAGSFKIAAMHYFPRVFALAVTVLMAAWVSLLVSCFYSHVWIGVVFNAAFALISLWGPFHAGDVAGRRA